MARPKKKAAKKKVAPVKKSPVTPPATIATKVKQVIKKIVNSKENEKSLLEGIKKTKESADKTITTVLEKGTVVEERLEAEQRAAEGKDKGKEQPPTSPNPNPNPAQPKAEEVKKKRGRPTGWKKKIDPISGEEELPEKPKIDPITSFLNGTAVPFLSIKFKKDMKECMFTQEQMEEMLKFQPESKLNEPSWPVYFMMVIGVGMQNFITAQNLMTEEKVNQMMNDRMDTNGREHPGFNDDGTIKKRTL